MHMNSVAVMLAIITVIICRLSSAPIRIRKVYFRSICLSTTACPGIEGNYQASTSSQDAGQINYVKFLKKILRPDGKRFQCKICSKSYSLKGDLKRHNQFHTGEKLLKCTFCGKKFTSKVLFTRHLRIHTGEKPFQCNFCRKSYSRKSYILRHIRIHTDERPYTCDICGKNFLYKWHLNRHLKTVHKQKLCHEATPCHDIQTVESFSKSISEPCHDIIECKHTESSNEDHVTTSSLKKRQCDNNSEEVYYLHKKFQWQKYQN